MMTNLIERLDRLLRTMVAGEPQKAGAKKDAPPNWVGDVLDSLKPLRALSARKSAKADQASDAEPPVSSSDTQTPRDTSGDASR